jgi:hypothetical protein
MLKRHRGYHEQDATAALALALAAAGLSVQPVQFATMVERCATMLETLDGWRAMIAARTGIRAPRNQAALEAAAAVLVAEVRDGRSELSGAHTSPAIELPGHVDCPDCLGLGLVRHESLGPGNVWATCDCADASALSSVDDGAWEMPAWQAASLLRVEDLQEETCAPTLRMSESTAE